MLGPIPNSLGAGAYNGSFIPHGLVTFSPRGAVLIVVVFQEVCLDAFLHPSVQADARLDQVAAVISTLHTLFATNAVVHDTVNVNSDLHDTIALVAQIEDC